MLMRRLSQIFRLHGHSGRRTYNVNTQHQTGLLQSWQAIIADSDKFTPNNSKERKMFDYSDGLRAHRMAALFFAVLAGTSAVSMAIGPAVLQF
jgi:hypothetical protein